MRVEFYKTASGRSPVREFISDLSAPVREEVFECFAKLANGKILSMPHSRSLAAIHSGLHELRFRGESGNYRIFYYIKVKDAIYLLHAFKKKTQQTPQKELQVALNRLREI